MGPTSFARLYLAFALYIRRANGAVACIGGGPCGPGDPGPKLRGGGGVGGPAAAAAAAAAAPEGRLSTRPPMGWSSWYAFGPRVSQELIEATLLKLSNRSAAPDGSNRSLQDAGYAFANIDDGWQACGAGVDGSFHGEDGAPLVNRTKFPDIAAMAARARAMGLRPGFYFNNYICNEGMPPGGIGGATYMRNMQGSVDFLAKTGFEYIKIDSGSVYNDLQLWRDLINASGREIVIENCHQGHMEPNSTWCPFDLFRTSGDLHVVGLDVELLATADALRSSRPGCWAYPDTLDPGSPAQVRSQFGAYAVMSAPLVLSFDILDDSKLLPVWDVFTNPEAIRVNQQWAGSAGRLVKKWALHRGADPLFPWAEPCSGGEPRQTGWRLDEGRKQIVWQPEGAAAMCLTARGTGLLYMAPCRAEDHEQLWSFDRGRLWQEAAASSRRQARRHGILGLQRCDASKPGQRWKLSAPPGHSKPSTVQNNISWMEGGCWEITGCEVRDGAEVGVNFGCKPLPRPGSSSAGGCDANGAWAFNSNGSITSVMDGKCLRVDSDNATVNVGSCTGSAAQRWRVEGESIASGSMEGYCIDSEIVSPPPGTTGSCAAVTSINDAGGAGSWQGQRGPGVRLAPGGDCQPQQAPGQLQSFSLEEGVLHAGDLCVGVRHGEPSSFGPLQLWAKAQPGGAVAAVVLNRAAEEARVEVPLCDLEELRVDANAMVQVRDIWARADLPPLPSGGFLQLTVPGGDSRFVLFTPEVVG